MQELIQKNAIDEINALKDLVEEFNSPELNYKALSEYFNLDTEMVGHNCTWICFDDSIQQLKNTINSINARNIEPKYLWRIIIMILHIISQEMIEILEMSGLNYKFINDKYPAITKIKRYANFLKHPKVRIFLHDPEYIICVSRSVEDRSYEKLLSFFKNQNEAESGLSITESEIKKFYSNQNAAEKLLSDFGNKRGVQIVLPASSDILQDLIKSIKLIISDYNKNPILTEALREVAIIEHGYLDDLLENYYETQAEIARGK